MSVRSILGLHWRRTLGKPVMCCLALIAACSVASADQATAPTLRNGRFSLRLTDANSGTFEMVRESGKPVTFNMRFVVGHADRDPNIAARPMSETDNPVKYNVVTWESQQIATGDKGAGIGAITDDRVSGDGFDPRILRGSTEGRTPDLFTAVPFDVLVPSATRISADRWDFDYPATPLGQLHATIHLPPGNVEPAIEFDWQPASAGFYTVGYVGAPAIDFDAVDEIFQPLIFQEKRFPQRSYLTLAYRCTIPASLVTHDGQTIGVAADPKELPFQPLPNQDNSRFGVAVRNPAGKAQSMVFAPALGGAGSQMKASDKFNFTLRLCLTPGRTADAFKDIAEGLCGVTRFRRNVDWTLNQTLDNIIAYGMSDFSRFREEMKGCAYDTDAPGTVKNVSSLNPLDMAIVSDDEAIFERRAYPYMEYMLSREKFLFTLNEDQKIQSPSYTLKGPCAPVSELSSLYTMSGKASGSFLELAIDESKRARARNLDDVDSPDKWTNALWLYRATGEQKYLDKAKAGADAYIAQRIDTPQTDFRDPDSGTPFFWTAFAPAFAQLTELYESTGDRRYLEGAHKAARQFAMFTWAVPVVPDEEVLVNEGGKAPIYPYLKNKGHKQMFAAEEKVPAWRLSEIGLTCESSGTSTGHRAIFMANYAPWLLRIGNLTNDSFLTTIARNSIVGRYRNIPGYHINTARTTIYEKLDYPLRAHDELSVNSFHYNHCWPMMSMILDYLVTDAITRSHGEISFPSQFIEGYAYLQNKAYGGQVGTFFGNRDAVLWMPRGLVTSESPQVNYIAARGNDGQLYLALMNESDAPLDTSISINEGFVSAVQNQEMAGTMIPVDGKRQEVTVVNGKTSIHIAPRGLTALILPHAKVSPKFQQKVMGLKQSDAWRTGLARFGEPAGRAMVLNLGPASTTAYVYLEDAKRELKSLEMTFTIAGESQTLTDDSFPWEFTVRLPANTSQFDFTLAATLPDQSRHTWKTVHLEK